MIDAALAAVSRAPRSYTERGYRRVFLSRVSHGADPCAGGPVCRRARQAAPGEFTRRRFERKLDLTQAEAVIDLIHAETPAAVYQAAGQLAGALSGRVEEIYQILVDVMAHFHAVLDYPEEDLEPFENETIARALARAQAELDGLLAPQKRGVHLTSGVPCAIVGGRMPGNPPAQRACSVTSAPS